MNIFGHNFRLAIWGESHGQQIGISIDGIPAGVPLSAEDFETDLARRRSGARGTTPRREPDIPQIVSGLYNGMTTGAPLTIEFANRRHPLAGLRQRDAPLPALARRHGGLPQIQRLQRPARRRPLLGPPDAWRSRPQAWSPRRYCRRA